MLLYARSRRKIFADDHVVRLRIHDNGVDGHLFDQAGTISAVRLQLKT